MKIAIFPGSFDPITCGHTDIIERASKVFDKVYVVIVENSDKHTMFTLEERLAFNKHSAQHIENVTCTYYHGLTIEYAKECGACAMIRGIRSMKDYEYEMDIASVNAHIDASVETILLFASPQYAHISSSILKEMVKYSQDIQSFVSKDVADAFHKRK